MWNDDSSEEENNGKFSFADIGRLEAAKTSKALLKIDEQLPFEYELQEADAKENIIESFEEGFTFDYRRYESNGYDAHSENVDKKEIQSWQKVFPYFLVRGVSMTPEESIHEDLSKSDEVGEFFPMATDDQSVEIRPNISSLSLINKSSQNTIPDLTVLGKKLTISPVLIQSDDKIHGHLDELIAVNVTPHNHDIQIDNEEISDSDVLSPNVLRQQEIVSTLLDAVWPEIVEVLKPLIRKVVRKSRSADITYELRQKNSDHIV